MDYAIELLKEAKAKKCDVVHSDPSDPCARHYVVKDKQDKENIDHDYEASIRPVPPYKFYHDIFTFKLWKKVTKRMAALHRKMQEKRTGIAHKTPRGAGGCPFGTGNVKVVEPGDCHWIEKQLGEVQGKVVEYYRR